MNDITSERENFTFNNFDELKGFLKGKTILVATASDAVKLNKVLQNLEFVHIPQLVLIADNRNKIVYKVSDTSFTREYYENIDTPNIDLIGEDVIEEYLNLKEQLVYSILPYPITILEARNMTLAKLNSLYEFASDILDKIPAYDLDDSDVDFLFGQYGLNTARTVVDNYEIQIDNIKYLG
jgi:hypothetical protein